VRDLPSLSTDKTGTISNSLALKAFIIAWSAGRFGRGNICVATLREAADNGREAPP
jgi:hypothetical protein